MKRLTLLPLLLLAVPAEAACDIKGIGLEDQIAKKSELRESANKQTVRDLRTLRDAAIVLDAYKYGAECERLVEIVKALAANPEKAIEQGGDTDEEKAESVEETREPKGPPVAAESAKDPAKAR
ncbi:photosystem reaction center subunit H [Methylobacterium durans]|uniref:Photosystem reaction center subunit H n=1 Tax=Methylobacterium durans TaxID=2202825 RepID=A0A2U8W7M1_9HYPH|nr:photosystem reaction center subunit H [Methylobacterium durans]AWN42105.1 photosystem reaction center subunit H [Methylobacterium durans]